MQRRSLPILLLLSLTFLQARSISVGREEAFEGLAEAIEASHQGDTIFVNGGTYKEFDLEINHQLTLIGMNDPVIDGEGKGEILRITADMVSVKGFTFRASGLSHLEENAAIRFEEAHNGHISQNTFIDNFFAIYISKSKGCHIEANVIRGRAKTESQSGNAIHLWYCTDAVIENNEVEGHRDGIYLEFVENCEIRGNHSIQNLRYGLHFMFSNRNQYHHNVFEDNGAGVAVMYSRHVDMWENVFARNWGSSAYGLLLKDIYDSTIIDNSFDQNTIGLYSEACNRVSIEGNSFKNNGWAVKVMANSMDNVFERNDFMSNTFDVSTNSRQNFNLFRNNYWSRYRGYDIDGDGVGDIPYRPVKLYSLIIEKNEPALMLMRSIFVDILDSAESYLPILTPATLIDEQPLMRPSS